MNIILGFLFFLNTIISFSQTAIVEKDTLSGFYLTKSFDGFTGENFETLILAEKPYIYISEVEKVSQDFDFRNRPVVTLKLKNEAKQKLNEISVAHSGEPLVIRFGTKIIMAPTIFGPIENGEVQISGNFTLEETASMVNWIKKRIEK